MSQPGTPQASALASLFIEAVRQGQALWFRVASNSMLPLMRLGDNVYIQPARASELRPGEIAAFETSSGLVIHRIIHYQQTEASVRLLQMSDVEFLPGWVKAQAVVGRVVSIRRQNRQVDLYHPIAKWCGRVTARIRYRLYLHHKNRLLQLLLRGCSRLVISLGYRCIRCCCASSVTNNNPCL
jgi:Peptidase S24-like